MVTCILLLITLIELLKKEKLTCQWSHGEKTAIYAIHFPRVETNCQKFILSVPVSTVNICDSASTQQNLKQIICGHNNIRPYDIVGVYYHYGSNYNFLI